jgi:hypothetical protein
MPRGAITTEGFSVVGRAEAGALPRLAEGEMDDEPETLKAAELLNLLWPLLKRLELAKKPGLELLPKDGVGCGAELAGVAIRVGFTLFLVRVATVVLTRKLVGLNRVSPFLLLFLSSCGLMTGVKVFPGLVKATLLRVRVGLTPLSSSAVSAKSSSMSWKLEVGRMVESGVSTEEAKMTSTSPDWISGTWVDAGPAVDRMVSTIVLSPS